jgi:hypothetical protein
LYPALASINPSSAHARLYIGPTLPVNSARTINPCVVGAIVAGIGVCVGAMTVRVGGSWDGVEIFISGVMVGRGAVSPQAVKTIIPIKTVNSQ